MTTPSGAPDAVAHEHAGPHQFPALDRVLRRDVAAPRGDARRQPVGQAAALESSQGRRLHGDDRARLRAGLRRGRPRRAQPALRARPPRPLAGSRRLHRSGAPRAGSSRGNARGMPLHIGPAFVVVANRDGLGRRHHLPDRVGEPARRAVANELSADQQHQHGRDDRQPEQRQHQLGAEAREWQSAPPLHHQLDDVARQDEGERDQHHQHARGERVDDNLGEEVGVHLRRLVGEDAHADESRDQGNDPEQDQARVVTERPPCDRAPAAPPPCAAGASGVCQ